MTEKLFGLLLLLFLITISNDIVVDEVVICYFHDKYHQSILK